MFKKSILQLFSFLLLSTSFLAAQPILEWEESYGGSEWELSRSILSTEDGGYIVASETGSTDGDIPGSQNNHKLWVMKLDQFGNISWQRFYGGNGGEGVSSIRKTNDGGYILTGYSYSSDGDVSNNYGFEDLWVLKIDAMGDIEWEKNYGGTDSESANAIQQTADNGFIIAGSSWSSDIDLTTNNGFRDWWILKITNSGEIEWQKTIGGSSAEIATDIIQVTGGGYICIGLSLSYDGDFNSTNGPGETDVWIVRLNSSGDILWKRNYGGSLGENIREIIQTSAGDFIAVGYSESNDNHLSTNNGGQDCWAFKINNAGVLVWSKSFGGAGDDFFTDIRELPSGKFLLSATSESSNLDTLTGNYGDQDIWLLLMNEQGEIEWGNNYGGSKDDYVSEIALTDDGGFILTGRSKSDDFDVSENQGDEDLWIAKFGNLFTNIEAIDTEVNFSLYPNPSPGKLQVEFDNNGEEVNIQIINTAGKIIREEVTRNNQITLAQLPKGVYWIRAKSASLNSTQQVMIY